MRETMNTPLLNDAFFLRLKRERIARRRALRRGMDFPSMTHTQKRILRILQTEWRFSNGGNSWDSTASLAAQIRRPVPETRQALYALRAAGVLHYSVACDEDGPPRGSGYFLRYPWDFE